MLEILTKIKIIFKLLSYNIEYLNKVHIAINKRNAMMVISNISFEFRFRFIYLLKCQSIAHDKACYTILSVGNKFDLPYRRVSKFNLDT